jgi:hypothetical protein
MNCVKDGGKVAGTGLGDPFGVGAAETGERHAGRVHLGDQLLGFRPLAQRRELAVAAEDALAVTAAGRVGSRPE